MQIRDGAFESHSINSTNQKLSLKRNQYIYATFDRFATRMQRFLLIILYIFCDYLLHDKLLLEQI